MKDKFSFIIIGLVILLFAFSSYKIMYMRFKKGDVYPEYSSLRHDPMGTSIFFQSLSKMGYQVETVVEMELSENVNPQETILFYLSPSFIVSKDTKEEIISFILSGGRVFLSDKQNNRLMNFFDTKIDPNENDDNKPGPEVNIPEAIPGEKFNFLNERLKIINKKALLSKWPKSQAVYRDGDQDIILLLSHGKGNIIISSETYFISNESLVKEPPVKFLTWIMNGRKRVLVDEYHHGISYEKGISFLLKKYHLYWFIAYLILIFILYLWHILPNFRIPIQVPLKENLRPRSSLQGYTQILSKTVPKNKLLDICISQWIKGSKNRFFKERNKREIDAIKDRIKLSDIDKNEKLISKYNEISNIITEQRRSL